MPYTSVITSSLLDAGEMIGDYAILRCISLGLLGGIYHARDRRLGGDCLLQILPEELTRKPSPLQAIESAIKSLREAKAKPLLVPDLVEEVSGRVCLRFPFVDGITLADYVAAPGRSEGLPESEVGFLLAGVSEAVEAACAAGVPHLTLVPENVLITTEGAVHVHGFGLFGALHRRRFEMFVSTAINPLSEASGTTVFTAIDAIAPEVRNEEPGNEQSDVYSLGVMGYYLLTGNKLGHDEWGLLEHRDDIAPGWDVLLRSATEVKLNERYGNVSAFRADLVSVTDLTTPTLSDAAHTTASKVAGSKRSIRAAKKKKKSSRLGRILIGSAALTVLGLVTASLLPGILFDDAADKSRAGPVHPSALADPQNANVILSVIPSRGSGRILTLGNQKFHYTDGSIGLDLTPGLHRVQLSAEGFRPTVVEIDVARNIVREQVQLEGVWGRLQIEGQPGTGVYAASGSGEVLTFVDEIPSDGVLRIDDRLLARSYILELRQEGYEPMLLENVTLKEEEWTHLEAFLVAKPGTLRVSTSEAGIPVAVDGQAHGVSPLILEGLAVGQPIVVTVGGSGWRAKEQSITLAAGETTDIDFGEIEAARGDLDLTVRTRAGPIDPAQLDVLRVKLGEAEIAGKASLKLTATAGAHRLVIEHPDFTTYSAPVEIKDRETTALEAVLAPLPSTLRLSRTTLGSMSFRLFIDGVPQENVFSGIELPAETEIEATLLVRDHEPHRERLILRAGADLLWEPELQPLAGPGSGEPWGVPYLDYNFNWFPPGTFRMGSPQNEPDRLPTEGPTTTVIFEHGFWVAIHETSQVLYEHFMEANPSKFVGPGLPVDSVTWLEASTFAQRLTQREAAAGRLPPGYEYRLPTEAEWEYAARSGSSEAFHWGTVADASVANVRGRYPRTFDRRVAHIEVEDRYGTLPVGSFQPNSSGLYDVHGNVREWTLDFYNDRHPGGRRIQPYRDNGQRGHVVRGGGWEDFAHRARAAARDRASADARNHATGFRIVLAPILSGH